jgi:hypothetical protein
MIFEITMMTTNSIIAIANIIATVKSHLAQEQEKRENTSEPN